MNFLQEMSGIDDMLGDDETGNNSGGSDGFLNCSILEVSGVGGDSQFVMFQLCNIGHMFTITRILLSFCELQHLVDPFGTHF